MSSGAWSPPGQASPDGCSRGRAQPSSATWPASRQRDRRARLEVCACDAILQASGLRVTPGDRSHALRLETALDQLVPDTDELLERLDASRWAAQRSVIRGPVRGASQSVGCTRSHGGAHCAGACVRWWLSDHDSSRPPSRPLTGHLPPHVRARGRGVRPGPLGAARRRRYGGLVASLCRGVRGSSPLVGLEAQPAPAVAPLAAAASSSPKRRTR